MQKDALIVATLAAHTVAAYRAPIAYRLTSWVHDQTGTRIGAGSSHPCPGTYTPVMRWTRTQDGGSSSCGKTFDTKEELLADMDAAFARSQANFRQALSTMTLPALKAQLAYWEGEAEKVKARA